jgi:drug/metabolite transporter (DMT)-like permease
MAISYTAPFLTFGPGITAVLAVMFLNEQITKLQYLGILVIMFGAYILYSHSHKNLLEPLRHMFRVHHMKYVWLGIVFYALTGLLDKKIVGVESGELGVPVLAYVTMLFFFIAIVFIIMMLLFHDGFSGIGNGMKGNAKWLTSVAALTITFKLLVFYALSLPGALLSLVIPIKKLSALFSTLLGGELMHEEHIARKTLACLVMVCGAILIVL